MGIKDINNNNNNNNKTTNKQTDNFFTCYDLC